jgi:hypothetical protein
MKRLFKKMMAFVKGALEFRLTFTTNYNDYGLLLAYDKGRETAHRLTLRRFEP